MVYNYQRMTNPIPFGAHFNWVECLTPREADVLGMHLYSYLDVDVYMFPNSEIIYHSKSFQLAQLRLHSDPLQTGMLMFLDHCMNSGFI